MLFRSPPPSRRRSGSCSHASLLADREPTLVPMVRSAPAPVSARRPMLPAPWLPSSLAPALGSGARPSLLALRRRAARLSRRQGESLRRCPCFPFPAVKTPMAPGVSLCCFSPWRARSASPCCAHRLPARCVLLDLPCRVAHTSARPWRVRGLNARPYRDLARHAAVRPPWRSTAVRQSSVSPRDSSSRYCRRCAVGSMSLSLSPR